MRVQDEKAMISREITRIEVIVKRMKVNDKIGNLEVILRGLRGRYQELEKLKPGDKKKNTTDKN